MIAGEKESVSLRDQLAMAALPVVAVGINMRQGANYEEVAWDAYLLADVMLEARERQPLQPETAEATKS